VTEPLRAPFPWFGGKRRIAEIVWQRFGDVPNYVEPFAGSLAVLLGRPTPAHTETVNDKDAYLANFWRAIQHAPELVAMHADWPVNEADLHARHRWLVAQGSFRDLMMADPNYYDPMIAGWWVWGISMWIGSGWCSRPEWSGRGPAAGHFARGINTREQPGVNTTKDQRYRRDYSRQAIPLQRPMLMAGGVGVHADVEASVPTQVRHLSRDGQGVHKKVPELATQRGGHRAGLVPEQIVDLYNGTGRGDAASGALGRLTEWFEALALRLRRVRVCCGEWDRIVTASPTWRIGLTGVLLDPPYGVEDRQGVYSHESRDLAAQVRQWAISNGDNPLLRIALCGYEGEHDMPPTWSVVAWKAQGGYGGQRKDGTNDNADRERVWFSPHCLKPEQMRGLFDDLEVA